MLDIIYERVGFTRSGKMIPYAVDRKDIASVVKHLRDEIFSNDDLLDAFALYEFLALRAKRRVDTGAIFEDHSNEVLLVISPEDLAESKMRASVYSAFQLRDLGKSLAAIEFIDF
ncbi:MAG: hypothetical protein NT027_14390 [Proteobacteria bacterium]|nr:hypothetical protein [Pseudomonadota bacterium]